MNERSLTRGVNVVGSSTVEQVNLYRIHLFSLDLLFINTAIYVLIQFKNICRCKKNINTFSSVT